MNILIVDDDEIIRNWLQLLLQQVHYCPVEVSCAGSGEDALQLMREQEFHLVVTDIRMPGISGLELIDRMKAEFPAVRVAVLSAYDDFTYVRTAIRMGALDYIPKAEMNLQDISDLIKKTMRDIEMEKSVQGGGALDSTKQMRRQELFREFMTQEDTPPGELLAALELPDQTEGLWLAAFGIRNPKKIAYPVYQALTICDNVVKGQRLRGGTLASEQGHYLLMHRGHGEADLPKEEFLRLFSLIDQTLENLLGLSVSYSINLQCPPGSNLRSQCSKALRLLTSRIYYARPQLPEQAATPRDEVSRKQNRLIRTLRQHLEADEYREAFEAFAGYLAEAHVALAAPKAIQRSGLAAMHMFRAHVAMLDTRHPAMARLNELEEEFEDITTQKEMEAWFGQFRSTYLAYIDTVYTQVSAPVKQAMQYINEHYSEKITLEEVAEHAGRNRTYLCELFSKELGTNFHDYLETVRISEASLLLRTTELSMSDIAEAVGFANQNYFSKIFKKVTLKSPSQYRKVL